MQGRFLQHGMMRQLRKRTNTRKKKETPGKECNEGKEDSYNSTHKKHQERNPRKTSTTQNVETAQEKKKC